ncbi:hypothetical protein QTJ16_003066 [Diplocarpon rosae]|uniref:Isochorismatase-like domain-containing protein n=1 Tax=Diplocarpon rosae TaxID=946125 RepID=A0AAD9T0I7_9HELO|nr:hypothetical protein QTJ16_003066 [Diplocarpon rosae]
MSLASTKDLNKAHQIKSSLTTPKRSRREFPWEADMESPTTEHCAEARRNSAVSFDSQTNSTSSEDHLASSESQPPCHGASHNRKHGLCKTVSGTETSIQRNPSTADFPARINALVIIDVQNEFISTRGNFPIHETCRPDLLQNLQALIPRFRHAGGEVVWVHAVYENPSEEPAAMRAQARGDGIVACNQWLVAATHVSRMPCCEAGSWGAEPYPEVFALAQPADAVVAKGTYSAFRGTTALLRTLRRRGVTDVFFAGCASGTCVLASVLDAIGIGEVRVHVVPDCLGWRRRNTHEEALRRFEELGVGLVESGEIGIGSTQRSSLPSAQVAPID